MMSASTPKSPEIPILSSTWNDLPLRAQGEPPIWRKINDQLEMREVHIMYHGTTVENANNIIKTKFRITNKGTVDSG